MTRAEYVADVVKEIGRKHAFDLPVKAPLQELAGKAFDGVNPKVTVVTENKTLTADDSGGIFLCATDNVVFTLPATAAGLKYTFINTGADGAAKISISPAAADAIHGTTNASTNVVLSGVDDKDAINTKATATTGDNMTIVGDGSVGWYVIGCHGIWASE